MKKSATGNIPPIEDYSLDPKHSNSCGRGGGGRICERILASTKINICINCGENRWTVISRCLPWWWSEQPNLLNKDSYVVLISDRSGRCLEDDLSSSHICKTNIIYGDTLCSGWVRYTSGIYRRKQCQGWGASYYCVAHSFYKERNLVMGDTGLFRSI